MRDSVFVQDDFHDHGSRDFCSVMGSWILRRRSLEDTRLGVEFGEVVGFFSVYGSVDFAGDFLVNLGEHLGEKLSVTVERGVGQLDGIGRMGSLHRGEGGRLCYCWFCEQRGGCGVGLRSWGWRGV